MKKLILNLCVLSGLLLGAKGWLYEGGIRVPMIVKWPGNGKRGLVCEVPVFSTDFFPAILEMAGLPAPQTLGFASAHNGSLVVSGVGE